MEGDPVPPEHSSAVKSLPLKEFHHHVPRSSTLVVVLVHSSVHLPSPDPPRPSAAVLAGCALPAVHPPDRPRPVRIHPDRPGPAHHPAPPDRVGPLHLRQP